MSKTEFPVYVKCMSRSCLNDYINLIFNLNTFER